MDLSVLDGYSSDDASDNCELPPKINSPRSTTPPEEYISGTADAESNPSGNQLDTGHGTFAPIYSREITPNHLPENELTSEQDNTEAVQLFTTIFQRRKGK